MALLWRSIVLLISLLTFSPSYAAGNKAALDSVEIDLSDKVSLQRGAHLFAQYCLSCHSAAYMRYNRIGKDLGMTDKEVKQALIFGHDKVGDTMTIAMQEDDAKKWFGVAPPDLSVIARSRGTDWLYTYLRSFYLDNSKPLGINNRLFKDVGMPHVMWQQQPDLASQKSTLSAETTDTDYDVMMRDLVNFLAYISEPSKIQRLAIGKWVLLYLAIFFVFAYALKKSYWKDVH